MRPNDWICYRKKRTGPHPDPVGLVKDDWS